MVLRVIKKFLNILSGYQKRRIGILIMLMILSGFLEMVSVSLVLPFMETIVDPLKVMGRPMVQSLCNYLGIKSDRAFLIFMALVLAMAYIIKNLFLMFETNIRVRFVYNCMLNTQISLFQTYMRRPYEFFLSVSSGEVIRIISNDTKDAFLLMETVLTFLTEVVIAVMLIITILIISPAITVAMTVIISITMALILLVIRPTIQRASVAYQKSSARMNNWMLQGIQGIKEIKVAQKEDYFSGHFAKNGKVYVKAVRKYTFFVQFPRFLIEAVSMSSLFIIIAYMIYCGIGFHVLVPIVSAIAMAAIRLLPSTSRISTQITDIAFKEPMLDKLIENLKVTNEMADTALVGRPKGIIQEFTNNVKLENISFKYTGTEKDVFTDASIKIQKGKSIGIVGASGAGKTTAVDILLGLLTPYKGQVSIDKKDIRSDMYGWLGRIGYIPQTIFIMDSTIRENVAFGIADADIDDGKVWNALEAAALSDFVSSLPEGIETQLGERGTRISGGQKQRIGIARALYDDPEILVFDEATSSLDNETENAIMDSIDKLHGTKTLVIIAHRLSTMRNCDEIYRVENGKFDFCSFDFNTYDNTMMYNK